MPEQSAAAQRASDWNNPFEGNQKCESQNTSYSYSIQVEMNGSSIGWVIKPAWQELE